jgi:hypothetical protein
MSLSSSFFVVEIKKRKVKEEGKRETEKWRRNDIEECLENSESVNRKTHRGTLCSDSAPVPTLPSEAFLFLFALLFFRVTWFSSLSKKRFGVVGTVLNLPNIKKILQCGLIRHGVMRREEGEEGEQEEAEGEVPTH